MTQQPHPLGFHGRVPQEPFCSQSCDGAVPWELLVSHTRLQVTHGPFLLLRVQMFLLRLFLRIWMGGLDASWRDWFASASQGSSAARGDLVLGFRSDKISSNFPIVLSSCLGSEVEVCKQKGWKRSIPKLATNSLFPESWGPTAKHLKINCSGGWKKDLRNTSLPAPSLGNQILHS